MGRSLVDSERSQGVRRGVYLPDVDEFRSSSGPLSGEFEPPQPPTSHAFVLLLYDDIVTLELFGFLAIYECVGESYGVSQHAEIVLECLDPVASSRAKPLKEGYVADITRLPSVTHPPPYLACCHSYTRECHWQ